ncbi:ATP-dependent protease ATPase subunit HslU [Fusobacterium sp.]|uniref:ATP-dependent protease ATPase subunit HslU n=1 Tax=Fusobacterium sp. TaxID=68766 RepID=UPI002601EFC4|nr:ATP-dependent protease ATPase subunit HslU [Fusobacterium sp.]
MIKSKLVPKKIVEELDKYIVSQEEAKKNVAVSLRNRYRRKEIKNETLRKEITPKNIILMGSTGVGKTEIARRLAKITDSPFLKVEATKYTEVGYVGKDVETMIKDLVAVTITKLKNQKIESLKKEYYMSAVENTAKKLNNLDTLNDEFKNELINDILEGKYDDEMVEVEKPKSSNVGAPIVEVVGAGDEREIGSVLENIMSTFDGNKKSKKMKLKVKDAIEFLLNKEINENIDMDEIIPQALKTAEEDGIIFIDEIDKIAERENSGRSEVSRQGVQRDILPIVEGTTVMTSYGPVKTDHILFIAAGAFSEADFSDLMPELQGRFPIVVEMKDLTKEDFIKILTDVEFNIIEQYKTLLEADNVEISFSKGAIEKIAETALKLNDNVENIGARRLAGIVELVLRDIMFEAPYDEPKKITIDKKYVEKIFKDQFEDENLDKYIL